MYADMKGNKSLNRQRRNQVGNSVVSPLLFFRLLHPLTLTKLPTFILQTLTNSIRVLDTAEKSDVQPSANAEKRARGEKTAENIRYGEAISEHGFGGETVGNSGGVEEGKETQDAKQTRREQGYGDGSGVGA
jgi:hypothetical protein